ncbi:3-hydroxyacyl-CoA dehydrogenase NAD-binding domain-containing protein [Sphingobium sp. EM0848]|uniref:3-hydroxyacyl-CoA dehydrogenase NAD-binding domain-containing protein n=1 Tax=Sphingobium sp. EM0848 TaxID=2743473 RepID=UPI00210131CF|nr:3-hydroxyacyl-CoA dehydrogenase NAD-binding domain-containing protein [Sphingobium sp. EM0848]
MSVVSIDLANDIGVITIDSPPVNALGIAVRKGIQSGMASCLSDDRVKAIVLLCAGRTFFAGADISEFGKPLEQPDLNEVLDLIENSPKPVIAAIHGTALGGGYETALVCHYRIAVPSAKVGLPEVNLGLLPGAGGTQRLPRIVGVEAALDIITGGQPIGAPRALQLGMIDALATEGRLKDDAVAFARQLVVEQRPLQRVRDRDDKVAAARGKPEIYAAYLARNAHAFRGFKAPYNIVKAIEASAELPFEEGMKREADLFHELLDSVESAAQRYYFFAERETTRIPDIGKDVAMLPVSSVGVIGAGTMGGGIAMNFLNASMPVTIVEADQDRLDRGLKVIRGNYENSAKKGRLTTAQVEERMALITPALSLEVLSEVDLVIEAVFEEMAVKKDIFARLDRVARPGAILASNTSFLDLDEIAAATSRPGDVVGLHFFSPANVMRLLEVVRGKETRKEIVATVMAIARKIGKVPVLSGVGYGFIANRVMAARMNEATALVLEGPTPADIDRAIYDYGFAMGPFQMFDLVGLDVVGRDSAERSLASDLVKLGRLGQKQNGGFYDYDERRKPTPSGAAAQVVADFAAFKGAKPSGPLADEAIVARLLYPVVNEAAKVLEEGIALRASDIDVACILGYGWPVHTGGPMFWADTVGLSKIVAGLQAQNIEPAQSLVEKAASGGSFTR